MPKMTSENYKSPTPWNIRKVADSVLAALGGGGAVAAIAGLNPVAAGIVSAIGIVAKFYSNYYSVSKKDKNNM